MTASPSPAARPSSTAAPVLDPSLCPASLTASYRTSDGIGIVGSAAFITQTENALALLRTKGPAFYSEVLAQVVVIRSVDSYSGMCYDSGTYRVGNATAYATGFAPDKQVVWYAGTIVHDAHHRTLQRAGLAFQGRDGELACLTRQRDALAAIDTDTYFRSYVQRLIDGVDDPKNQYWTDPNRHW